MFRWTNLFAKEASCPIQKVGNIGFILSMRGFLRFVSGVEELGMTLSIALIRRSGTRQTPNMVTGWKRDGTQKGDREDPGPLAVKDTDVVGKRVSVNNLGIPEFDSHDETNGSDTNPTLGIAQGITSAKNLTTLLLQTADN